VAPIRQGLPCTPVCSASFPQVHFERFGRGRCGPAPSFPSYWRPVSRHARLPPSPVPSLLPPPLILFIRAALRTPGNPSPCAELFGTPLPSLEGVLVRVGLFSFFACKRSWFPPCLGLFPSFLPFSLCQPLLIKALFVWKD